MRITTDEQFKAEQAKLKDLDPKVGRFINYTWRILCEQGQGDDLPDIAEMLQIFSEFINELTTQQ